MSDLYVWKTHLFDINIGALIILKHRINDQFSFLLMEIVYLNYAYHIFV